MSECKSDLRDRLPEYVHGLLAPARRAEMEAHLASCAECRGEVALLRTAREAIVRRTPAVSAERVAGAVRSTRVSGTLPGTRPRMERVRRPMPQYAWRIAAAIALIATGAMGYFVGRRGTVPPPSQLATNPVVPAAPAPVPGAPKPVPLQHPEPQMPAVTAANTGLTFGGGLSDLSAAQADALMKDLDGIAATIDAEPEPDLDLGSGQ